MSLTKNQWTYLWKALTFLLLALIIYQPIFGHLGVMPLRQWDEARLANSALEMYRNGLSVVVTYAGDPDTWNTKPPLMIWAQTLAMHFFGPNELAIRLPSAMAALGTSILLLWFSNKVIGNIWMGYLGTVVLITTWGYVDTHGSRTGDYDALLTLFTTYYSLLFYLFLQHGKKRYLYLFFTGLALAGLTKGISAFIFLPALLAFAFYKRKVLSILKNPHFYIGLIIPVVLVCGYYLSREFINPGYLNAVWKNELGGRYLTILESHQHSVWWYLNNMFTERYTSWFLFLIIGLIYNTQLRDKSQKQLNSYLILTTFFYLLVISTAQTKLHWYDTPLYPLFAIIIGLFLYNAGLGFIDYGKKKSLQKQRVLAIAIISCIFFKPYFDIVKKTYKGNETPDQEDFYRMGKYLQLALKEDVLLENTTIIHQGVYSDHLWYYVQLMNARNLNVKLQLNKLESYGTGDTLIMYQPQTKGYYWERYNFEVINAYHNVETWVIGEPKL